MSIFKKRLRSFWNLLKGKRLLYIGIFFVFSLLLYFITWNVIGYNIQQKIDAKIQNIRQNNINLKVNNYSLSGFPHSLSLHFHDPVFSNRDRTFGWTTKSLRVTPLVFEDKTIRIDFPEDQIFSVYRSYFDRIDKIVMRTDKFKISTAIKDEIPHPYHIMADNVILQIYDLSQTFKIGKVTMLIDNQKLLFEEQLEDIISAELNIFDMKLTPFWRAIIETDITQITGLVHLRHPSRIKDIPKLRFYALRGFSPPEVIIDKVKIFHNLSDFIFSGTLTLDKDMSLNGEISVNISDYKKIIHFLERKNVITASFASELRGMLSFVKTTSFVPKVDDTLTVSLGVRKNSVYFNGIPIFEIPQIIEP